MGSEEMFIRPKYDIIYALTCTIGAWLQELIKDIHSPIYKPTVTSGDDQSATNLAKIQFDMQVLSKLRSSITSYVKGSLMETLMLDV